MLVDKQNTEKYMYKISSGVPTKRRKSRQSRKYSLQKVGRCAPSLMLSSLGGKLYYTDPMLTSRYSGNQYIFFKYVSTSSGNKFSKKRKEN